jgi:23S rRNA-/tRNA-specific pseudouridylate synthase
VKPLVILCRVETVLSEMLDRLGDGSADALAEGRIFIGTHRATRPSDRVPAGTEVIRYTARPVAGDSGAAQAAASARFRVVHEAHGLVAAFKPAGIATVADHHGHAGTLVEQTAAAIGLPKERLFPTSRLDVGVSGIVVFATSDRARQSIAKARAEGRYRRHYVAIGGGNVTPERGRWTAPIGRDKDPRKRRAHGRDAVIAETAYAVAGVVAGACLLAAEPETGRTHQIRVHAADAGAALLGDRAYGGMTRLVSPSGAVRALDRIALHAAWIDIALERPFAAEAPVPDELVSLWSALGGDEAAWQVAMLKLAP